MIASDEYLGVVTFGDNWWAGRLYGPGLPEGGAIAAGRSLEELHAEMRSLYDEVTEGRAGSGSGPVFEYDMDAPIAAAVDRFRRARKNATDEYARLGFIAAGMLASWHQASLREIASTLGVRYLRAALLLARPQLPHRFRTVHGGWRQWRSRLLHDLPWKVAYIAAQRARQARIIVADKVQRDCLAPFR